MAIKAPSKLVLVYLSSYSPLHTHFHSVATWTGPNVYSLCSVLLGVPSILPSLHIQLFHLVRPTNLSRLFALALPSESFPQSLNQVGFFCALELHVTFSVTLFLSLSQPVYDNEV